MNKLEQEMVDYMANEIAKSIDFEIMCDMLLGCGWTKVHSSRLENAHGLDDWLTTISPRKFMRHDTEIIFEGKEDALMFSLRWP